MKRRWHKSFFLNIGVSLILGGSAWLVDSWEGLLIAVAGYIVGGGMVLIAAAEAHAIDREQQQARLEALWESEKLRGPL